MTSVGRLSVRVYSTQAELPVEGATVVVTRNGKAGKYELLSVQVTDSSGMIQPIEIAAPEAWESMQPNSGEMEAPYTSCNVWVEHPDYAMLQMDGVQIFSGVETVQNVELIPLSDGQTSLQQRSIREITTQNL